MDNDERPVLIVTDKDGYLISAGAPENKTGDDLLSIVKAGHNINQRTTKEYRETNYTWIYDKPKTENV